MFKILTSTSCSFWKCCETFGSRCFKIGKLILPSICFQAILSPLDRSCLSYEIFKSIESSKLNKMHISPQILRWSESGKLNENTMNEKQNSFNKSTRFLSSLPDLSKSHGTQTDQPNILLYYCLLSAVKSGRHGRLHWHGLPGGVGPVEQLILSWSVGAPPIQPVLHRTTVRPTPTY